MLKYLMTKYKNKLMLDADYYGVDTYMLGEDVNTSSLRIMIKAFMIILILGVIIVGTTYFIKNNFQTISSGFYDVKKMLIFESRPPILIREEPKREEPKIIRKVVPITVPSEEMLIVEQINEVLSSSKVEPKVMDSEVLSDEYTKLMQKSLGNY